MTTPDTSDLTGGRTRTRSGAFVVGGGRLGQRVANRLTEAGETVTFVDRTPSVDTAPGQSVELVEAFDGSSLEAVGFDDASTVFALTDRDATNLLVAQLARSRFGVERVVVRVNDPDRAPAFDGVDVDTVDAEAVLADGILEQW